jgi:hypothetical protein
MVDSTMSTLRITEWFHAHFKKTDGVFAKRFGPKYNANCVVTNVETLWQHYVYHLSKNGMALHAPPKDFFIYILRQHLGVVIKHVKNRYIGSIKHAALVCPINAIRVADEAPITWHPSRGLVVSVH